MGAGPTAQSPDRTINRRQLFKYGTAAGAGATIAPMLPPLTAAAHAGGLPRVLPAPKPIPGGIQLPDGSVIHVFAPGPPDVTLPFTGIQLMGLDVGAQRHHRLQGRHRPGRPRRHGHRQR